MIRRTSFSRLTASLVAMVFILTSAYGTDWNTALLHTAANVSYLSENEKNVIFEINKLRSDPVGYAREYLEPLRSFYMGKKLYLPGDIPIQTKEGVTALTDAIRSLTKSSPLPVLFPDERLTKASGDHRKDQTLHGGTGHEGSDGSTAQSRIRRYGTITRALGENIFYGESDARLIVMHLVIDDGNPGRGHRKNLLDKDFRLIGVSIGRHPTWRHACVIDFTWGFK
jgi:hypothetical protein